MFTDIRGIDDPVPSKSISALFPSISVGIADDTASADLDVKSVMRVSANPQIRCELGMKDVIEGVRATSEQIIS